MTVATDVAADAFQMELDGILRGLVQTVNEEAAATVAEALDPTRESHRELKSAAEAARTTVTDAGELVTALKDVKSQLTATVSQSETLNTQLKSAIDGLETKRLEHEKAMQTRLAEIDESVRGRGTSTVIAVVVCSVVLFFTVLGAS